MRMTNEKWNELQKLSKLSDEQINALKEDRIERARKHVEAETLKNDDYVFNVRKHQINAKHDALVLEALYDNLKFDYEVSLLKCKDKEEEQKAKMKYEKRKRNLSEKFNDNNLYTFMDIMEKGHQTENRPFNEHEECVLYMFHVMHNKRVINQCKFLSAWIMHATSYLDIYQDVCMMINKKPDMVSVLGMFQVRTKQLANNAIRKTVSFYRRFNCIQMGDNEGRMMEDHLAKGSMAFDNIHQFITMLNMDIDEILEPEEKMIFELFYLEDMKMLDIDKVMAEVTGKEKYRCDRKKERALLKISEWFVNTVDSYHEKPTEKMNVGIISYDGNINLSKYGTYKGNAPAEAYRRYDNDTDSVYMAIMEAYEEEKAEFVTYETKETISRGINIGEWKNYVKVGELSK